MKKIIILIGLFILGTAAILTVQNSQDGGADKIEENIQLANPASAFCEKEGGTLEIRTSIDGSQRGFCLFNDGSECEEWKFFNSECKKGEIFCKDLCGDGICQEMVCLAIGCPCSETAETCPQDCERNIEPENIALEIKDFTTDKKIYGSYETLTAYLIISSSEEMQDVVIKLTGIKPYNRAYINGSQTVNLNSGENEIIFTEQTPRCTSGCGGVYPGPYDLDIEVFVEENLVASSTVSINLTNN